jgi:UDP-N-acetylmuramoyl-L-alanyl-D-glutamate--2,6-diaminopimelate ligase
MANKGKKLSELAGLASARTLGDTDPIVTDVTHDSRKARPGSLYVALRGTNVDGHRFLSAAVGQGAVAICVDHETASQVPQIIVDDTRAVLGELAAAVYDYPSSSLQVIGVTGTNGKTTVTHYIESIALQAGLAAGLIGTIHTRIAGIEVPAEMTTPEASEFQSLLAEMRDEGVSVVAAEVSSHALEYGRVRATRFAAAAFTNMSQDHLDFHGDMASYRAAKERLFREYEIGTAVLNIDDPVGAEIASSYRGEAVTVGARGDLRASSLRFVPGGTGFRFHSPWGTADVVAPVFGDFNVSNLMIAASCCLVIGMDFATVSANLGTVDGVRPLRDRLGRRSDHGHRRLRPHS